MQNFIIELVLEKTTIFSPKSAENCYHNIDPSRSKVAANKNINAESLRTVKRSVSQCAAFSIMLKYGVTKMQNAN
jgi:hypothetical protein